MVLSTIHTLNALLLFLNSNWTENPSWFSEWWKISFGCWKLCSAFSDQGTHFQPCIWLVLDKIFDAWLALYMWYISRAFHLYSPTFLLCMSILERLVSLPAWIDDCFLGFTDYFLSFLACKINVQLLYRLISWNS